MSDDSISQRKSRTRPTPAPHAQRCSEDDARCAVGRSEIPSGGCCRAAGIGQAEHERAPVDPRDLLPQGPARRPTEDVPCATMTSLFCVFSSGEDGGLALVWFKSDSMPYNAKPRQARRNLAPEPRRSSCFNFITNHVRGCGVCVCGVNSNILVLVEIAML